jgi:hypothetical protein
MSPANVANYRGPANSLHGYHSGSTTVVRPTEWWMAPPSPQLERIVVYKSAPWLPVAYEDLRRLQDSGQRIPGLGDLRISQVTADEARRILTLASTIQVPKPTVVPFSGGGIGLTWNLDNREITFNIFPGEREVDFARTTEEDENIVEGSLALDSGDFVSRLSGVLGSFVSNTD